MKLINITDITGYLFCPRKVFLKLVKGIKEKPNERMILGMIRHKIFDDFNKNEQTIVESITKPLKTSEIKTIYNNSLTSITNKVLSNYSNMLKAWNIDKNEFNEVKEKIENETKLKISSILETMNKGFLGKQLWENLKPKFLTEYELISEKFRLKGRIDRLEIGNEIIPYELKSRENIYDSDKIQLAAYALLLEDFFNKKISFGIIETKSQKQEIIINEEMKKQVLEIADKIRNMKDAEITSNFGKCQNCGLREECFG